MAAAAAAAAAVRGAAGQAAGEAGGAAGGGFSFFSRQPVSFLRLDEAEGEGGAEGEERKEEKAESDPGRYWPVKNEELATFHLLDNGYDFSGDGGADTGDAAAAAGAEGAQTEQQEEQQEEGEGTLLQDTLLGGRSSTLIESACHHGCDVVAGADEIKELVWLMHPKSASNEAHGALAVHRVENMIVLDPMEEPHHWQERTPRPPPVLPDTALKSEGGEDTTPTSPLSAKTTGKGTGRTSPSNHRDVQAGQVFASRARHKALHERETLHKWKAALASEERHLAQAMARTADAAARVRAAEHRFEAACQHAECLQMEVEDLRSAAASRGTTAADQCDDEADPPSAMVLYNRFLAHSIAHASTAASASLVSTASSSSASSSASAHEDRPSRQQQLIEFLSQTSAAGRFRQVGVWRVAGMSIMLGSDLLIVQNPHHPRITLHLREGTHALSTRELLDLWLLNSMLCVPEFAVCRHVHGRVVTAEYEVFSTQAVYERYRSEANDILESAVRVLLWLRRHVATQQETYQLRAASRLAQMQDDTAATMCVGQRVFELSRFAPSAAAVAAKAAATGPAVLTSSVGRGASAASVPKPLQPFREHVASVLLQSALHLLHNNNRDPSAFTTDMRKCNDLLQRCAELLHEHCEEEAAQRHVRRCELLLSLVKLLRVWVLVQLEFHRRDFAPETCLDSVAATLFGHVAVEGYEPIPAFQAAMGLSAPALVRLPWVQPPSPQQQQQQQQAAAPSLNRQRNKNRKRNKNKKKSRQSKRASGKEEPAQTPSPGPTLETKETRMHVITAWRLLLSTASVMARLARPASPVQRRGHSGRRPFRPSCIHAPSDRQLHGFFREMLLVWGNVLILTLATPMDVEEDARLHQQRHLHMGSSSLSSSSSSGGTRHMTALRMLCLAQLRKLAPLLRAVQHARTPRNTRELQGQLLFPIEDLESFVRLCAPAVLLRMLSATTSASEPAAASSPPITVTAVLFSLVDAVSTSMADPLSRGAQLAGLPASGGGESDTKDGSVTSEEEQQKRADDGLASALDDETVQACTAGSRVAELLPAGVAGQDPVTACLSRLANPRTLHRLRDVDTVSLAVLLLSHAAQPAASWSSSWLQHVHLGVIFAHNEAALARLLAATGNVAPVACQQDTIMHIRSAARHLGVAAHVATALGLQERCLAISQNIAQSFSTVADALAGEVQARRCADDACEAAYTHPTTQQHAPTHTHAHQMRWSDTDLLALLDAVGCSRSSPEFEPARSLGVLGDRILQCVGRTKQGIHDGWLVTAALKQNRMVLDLCMQTHLSAVCHRMFRCPPEHLAGSDEFLAHVRTLLATALSALTVSDDVPSASSRCGASLVHGCLRLLQADMALAVGSGATSNHGAHSAREHLAAALEDSAVDVSDSSIPCEVRMSCLQLAAQVYLGMARQRLLQGPCENDAARRKQVVQHCEHAQQAIHAASDLVATAMLGDGDDGGTSLVSMPQLRAQRTLLLEQVQQVRRSMD